MTALSKNTKQASRLQDIYRGAIQFEDTAHRRGDFKFGNWISFLDLKIDWSSKDNSIHLSLYRKPIVVKLAIGIDIALSDTDTVQMSRVFASETIGFYNLNSRYSGFMSDCLRLCTDFLDKGYPPHLLFDGLIKIWRKEAHDFTKFGNQLKNWHTDLLTLLPARFSLTNRNPRTTSSVMNAVTITPLATHTPTTTPFPFVAAATSNSFNSNTPDHDSGFYHWYQHYRKRRRLSALGKHASLELHGRATWARYSSHRKRQLGNTPLHHIPSHARQIHKRRRTGKK